MIVQTEDVRVHTLHLSGQQAIPWHKHSLVDDTFVCLSGRTVVLTDGECESCTLNPGDRVTVPAGVGHFVKPDTEFGTKFLLIQATGEHDFIPLPDHDERKAGQSK